MLTGQAVISSDGRGANIAFSWTGLVGEDADDIGAPLHFLIEALQGVGRMQFGALTPEFPPPPPTLTRGR